MAGIRIEFSQFGDFDSFSIVKSQIKMNENDLPEPIVTNLKTMFYVDTDVTPNAAYFYRVIAIRGVEHAISNEIEAIASTGFTYASILHFDEVDQSTIFYDHAVGENWKTLNAIISTVTSKQGNSCAYFNGASDCYIYQYTEMQFSGDFSVTIFLSLTEFINDYSLVWVYGTASIRFGDGGFGNKLQVAIDATALSTVYSCALTKSDFIGTGFRKVEFRRIAGKCSLLVDDVVQNLNYGANPSSYPFSYFTDTTTIKNVDQPKFDVMKIGGRLKGYIDEFSIKKLS
ncbi:fibronectin type III domain-containing protein [Acinetobacter chinensis]|uniref:hypothetical protein n=1 Tax=Acinetobacter chinensis TaxID=2004650 RepID=UPI0029348D41|nr:hypothetical protein [Acinetobacter chinensis]WOE40683.1 hypothetical protein QSG87_12420 [Acinetobacter chinensis]